MPGDLLFCFQLRLLLPWLLRGQKEVAGLQLMVKSYTANPKFGDTKKLQGELRAAASKVTRGRMTNIRRRRQG